ncbi:protein starmaker [Drosophila subobscura]|uniref:protein starmaker n=1 Tax=Drosophila subobscura TaxID=7241 RepID=UPI00155A4ECA|nr:protein starmaker [Drosophila subobscura]
MSCICQYYTPGVDSGMAQVGFPLKADKESPSENVVKDAEKETSEMTLPASDLADCRAENWLLKKKLMDFEITIENLQQLVSMIVEKQHRILIEMFELRKENRELQTECHLQREYHSMERNALMKQLHDIQTLSRNRSLELGSGSIEIDDNRSPEVREEAELSAEEQDETDDECESDIEYDSYEDQDSCTDDVDCEDLSETSPKTSRSSSPYSNGSESEDTDSQTAKNQDCENDSDSDSDQESDGDSDTD